MEVDYPISSSVQLRIYKFECPIPPTDTNKIATMSAYAHDDNGNYHFEVGGTFITDPVNFPKGFYRAEVIIHGCIADYVDIIKAPSAYTASAISVSDKCVKDTGFVEPDCQGGEPTAEELAAMKEAAENANCDCWATGADGCPNCLGSKVVKACHNPYPEYCPPDPIIPPTTTPGPGCNSCPPCGLCGDASPTTTPAPTTTSDPCSC